MNSAQRPPHHRIEACSSALRRRLWNVQRTDALGPRIRQAAYDLHQRAYRLRGHMAQRIGARRRVRRRTWASITVQRLSLNAVVAPNRPRKVSDACRFGKSEISLAPSGKSVIKEMPFLEKPAEGKHVEPTGQRSDFVEIARRNGDFKKNYGTWIGAFLYLRSLTAARGRSFCWLSLNCALLSAALTWLAKLGRW